MDRYKILTGDSLSEEIYLKTWELDNETFSEKDKISKELAIEWFYASCKSTIVLWDQKKDELVGYITPFLLKNEFSKKYITSDINYKDAINKNTFIKNLQNRQGDIYIFSTVIASKYRDKIIETKDASSIMYNKTVFKVLNEALVDWIYNVKKSGVIINYIFADRVSAAGEKYLRSLKMQPCFSTVDDQKFARTFSPACFDKCSNVDKLYELYEKDITGIPYDKSILKNHEYLEFKDNVLHYCGINLLELAEKYQAPLEVAYTPLITQRIETLKKLFANKIKKYNYQGNYFYAYATKANYYSEVVTTAFNNIDMLETSSAYDISIILRLVQLGIIKPGYTVICNGFKNQEYINTLKLLLDKGINVIPVIENEKEYSILSEIKEYKINVGLRYNSDFEARLIKNNFGKYDEFDNRFGFSESELTMMAEKINNTPNLSLKILHFHFGGTISNIDNYIKGFGNIFNIYCKLKKTYDSLEYFDFGGGLPVKYSLDFSFDYNYLADQIVKTASSLVKKNKIQAPNLIGEHGRYTVADHGFYIYKIDFTKLSNNKYWYIINGSLMNMTPDMWGIEQDFTILPVNLINNDCIPVRLGGETCDPDDRYFLRNKNIPLYLPKINDDETLYIAVFSVGAYQEIISGIDGVHHCLIPEGNELVILRDKEQKLEFLKVNDRQDVSDILKTLDYSDENYIKKFYQEK